MNYNQLEESLKSDFTYSNISDEELLKHFKMKFESTKYNEDVLYVFNNNREFKGNNHIIAFHQRNSGKVPMHIYHYTVITYVYSGTLLITVEDKLIELSKGDLIIIDKHVPHSVEKTGPDDLGINIILKETYFSKKFINYLPNDQRLYQFLMELMNESQEHNHYLIFNTQDDELTLNCIQNILCEHLSPFVCSNDLIDNFIMILITHILRKFKYDTNLTVNMFKNKGLMNDILNYIKHHYIEGNLQNMCHYFGYDPSYTSKLIKQFSGKTFKQLINTERMNNALILLNNPNIPVYEVAERVGISNLTVFYKKFREYHGCTPQKYRDSL